jgi:alkylated DNA repair dioxygenase AlkB
MELFSKTITNMLPFDGIAQYCGKILDDAQCVFYFKRLLDNIEWKHDEVEIFGKHIITKRMTAWYGDKDYAYTYSRITRNALPWTDELLQLKLLVEAHSGASYNSCLLNLYHDGEEGMSWHSDNEDTLVANAAIASLSVGVERKFSFRHKRSKETVSVMLENGSLLVMKGETQLHWLHALPKSKKVAQPRINLTFRKMKD